MFEPNSRYYGLNVKTLTRAGADGQPHEVRYVERRLVPPPDAQPAVAEHAVIQGERLDQITAKYLGDPTQFWRVADANTAMLPEELTDEAGRHIVIPLPRS